MATDDWRRRLTTATDDGDWRPRLAYRDWATATDHRDWRRLTDDGD
jgi:hypothetical protein